MTNPVTVTDLMELLRKYTQASDDVHEYFVSDMSAPDEEVAEYHNRRNALELALTQLVQERDAAVEQLDVLERAVAELNSFDAPAEVVKARTERDRLEKERDAAVYDVEHWKGKANDEWTRAHALLARNERLKSAIRKSPETYQYVEEDDDTWHGQQFCWFCDGEMASQQVNHKAGCVWVECRPDCIVTEKGGGQ